MKKLFSVLQYKEGLIAVDKGADIQVGDCYYTSLEHDLPDIQTCKTVDKSKEYWLDGGLKYIMLPNTNWGSVKIVAAPANLSLDGVPVLDVPDDIDEKAKVCAAFIDTKGIDGKSYHVGFREGYKASGGYTEEDIICFYRHVKMHTYAEAIEHMKKLKSKTPTGVWLEMDEEITDAFVEEAMKETAGKLYDYSKVKVSEEIIKLTPDNHVVVVGWEY